MRVHQYTKTITKTRRKNERRTACRLQTRSASSPHGRAYSAKESDSPGLITPGAPCSVNSLHRRADSAKRINFLGLKALCALTGLILWACLLLQSQPTDSLENTSCRGSCSVSISVAPLKHETREIRYINLKFQFVVHGNKHVNHKNNTKADNRILLQTRKVRLTQITKR